MLRNFTIRDLDKIISIDGELKKVEINRLNAPGENFFSLVLQVDIQVEKNGKIETIKAIAKRLPIVEFGIEFHLSAMKCEINWYTEFLPKFQQFAKEWNINTDFFPKYLGSRLDSANEEAVLVLDNLIFKGYRNTDRYIGFNLNETKAILKTLAQFHAIPLIMKYKNEEKFQFVKSFIEENRPIPPPWRKRRDNNPADGYYLERVLIDQILSFPECKRYKRNIENIAGQLKSPPNFSVATKEIWNTIVHNDCWVNNIMVKTDENEMVSIKLVDYQQCQFGSSVGDVIFFLLTSVQDQVQRQHLDELIKFYYDEFTAILENANIPALKIPYENYLDSIEFLMKEKQIGHVLFLCNTIFGNKDNVPDILIGEQNIAEYLQFCLGNMTQRKKEKIILIIELAVQRGWM